MAPELSFGMASTLALPDAALQATARAWQRHGARVPGVVVALLAIGIGSTLADLAWRLAPTPEGARWQPPPALAAAPRKSSSIDPAAIINAHLFGNYEAPAVTQQTAATAPETALNLSLVGLLADRDERYSRALIAVQGAEERAYAVGDDITRGVTLQAIFPDRVILSRNGRLETLSLERDKPGAAGVASAPVVDSAQTAAAPLAQIRQEILQDPARASEYVRVQPATVAGQLKGYRIYPGRDRAAFTAAGLRPGDLVTAVNGIQLDDPAKALQMLSDLGQAGQVNLVIERGGQAENISISFY